MSLERRIRQQLADLRQRNALRSPPVVSHRAGVHYHLDGRPVVGFCSNDYLGLASEPTAGEGPAGAGASRLICGDLPEHRAVERALADFAGTPDAVLFPSGYQLNVGVLPAVLAESDTAHSDRLNHASLIDGLRLARASLQILPHLQAPTARGPGHWWITESIYSMDGDAISPTDAAAHVEAGGHLYVDEAHAIGLFGGGSGLLSSGHRPDVLVGTLSKAFGVAGAFAAASDELCDWIRNRARSYVFSTGPSPALMPAIQHALDVVTGAQGDQRRAALWDNVGRLAERLGLPSAPASPIIPLVVGPNDLTLSMAALLLERGWHVQPIRPPTVPDGTARLRLTLSALHTDAQIDGLAADLRQLFDAAELPLSPRTSRAETSAAGAAQ